MITFTEILHDLEAKARRAARQARSTGDHYRETRLTEMARILDEAMLDVRAQEIGLNQEVTHA